MAVSNFERYFAPELAQQIAQTIEPGSVLGIAHRLAVRFDCGRGPVCLGQEFAL